MAKSNLVKILKSTAILTLLMARLCAADFVKLPASMGFGSSKPIRSKSFHGTDSFVTPNELQPQYARPAWEASAPGVYISVGTERGFIGAAYSNATHLLLLDRTPMVVLFNRINIALLKASAGDRERYRQWRRDAHQLKEELAELPISLAERAMIREALASNWWQRVTEAFRSHPFLRTQSTDQEDLAFENAHYINDPGAFEKIYSMAANDRIQAEQFELSYTDEIPVLSKALLQASLKISVIDLSNAWWSQYISPRGTRNLLNRFKANASHETLVIITDRNHSTHGGWDYYAANFMELESKNFFKSMLKGEGFRDQFTALPAKTFDTGTALDLDIKRPSSANTCEYVFWRTAVVRAKWMIRGLAR